MTKQLQTDVPEYITIIRREEVADSTYCYVAFHPELPNIMSQSDTPEEAEENLVEETELTLAHLKANNLPIPKPLLIWNGIPLSLGETIPYEVALVGKRELTEDEIEYGKELESLALEYLEG